MKRLQKKLLTAIVLLGLASGLSSCVGYIEGGPGYYDRYPGYYGRDRWYRDGPWMDGPRGYIGIEISPVRLRRHR